MLLTKGEYMADVRPFRGIRPEFENAEKVACPPYDVLNTAEAREIIAGNDASFLRIVRSEADLPEGVDPCSPEVYGRARENLASFLKKGLLIQDENPSFYLYTLVEGVHRQTGLIAGASAEEYIAGSIRKHELTRKAKEEDRVRHIDSLNVNSGPVLLTYEADMEIDALVRKCVEREPVAAFEDEAGVEHILHKIDDGIVVEEFRNLFSKIDTLYIADGHHRSASAARVFEKRRDANSAHTGDEEYCFFLSVIFPDEQLKILAYNRVVKDLKGLTEAAFLEKVEEAFQVTRSGVKEPTAKGEFSMYLSGKWYTLTPSAPLAGAILQQLDVSVLQDRLLQPVLGINDPRKDERIDFVGGSRGTAELEKLVDEGGFSVAFSMFPTSIDELTGVAKQGGIMPPKSTWFAPKLRSGLVIHSLD